MLASRVLYSAWFCPYAQRVWTALNELGVQYELVEALTIDPRTEEYTKHPGLLEANPEGLVPTLVQRQKTAEGSAKPLVFCDSVEILRALFREHGVGERNKALLACLYEESKMWNRRICSPFYAALMKQDDIERMEGWEEMLDGLSSFCANLQWQDGNGSSDDAKISFYKNESWRGVLGERPSMVDFTVFPWVQRLYILDHFKGLRLPEASREEMEVKRKLSAWQAKMQALPSVRQTLADRDNLTKVYVRYADGTAKSKVGEAVRQGKEAHAV